MTMKTKIIYVCQNCGAQSLRWVGKCPSCQSWHTYVEESVPATSSTVKRAAAFQGDPVLLSDFKSEDLDRLPTDIQELDRVLGGGLIPGAVILIGGDPGIGKSTLTLQMCSAIGRRGRNVLYVSGEESIQQIKLRADRIANGSNENIYIINQVELNVITEQIKRIKPDVVVIDSIQVLFNPEIPSSPGSVAQVRECASLLTQMAKSQGISLFLIGHVTKDGMLAGPRVLEHIVDTVLYFEGERYSSYRILRTTKNRFGSTNELGVFEMSSTGIREVSNPSEIFLSERPEETSGSVVVPILEGTRPLLVEIQGLVSRSSFGMVRQKAQGFDSNRLALLAAILEKRMDLNLQDKDIFLNVVGGVKVMDPAADLGVVMAIASSLLDKVVPKDMIFLGEVGLSGEVRSVSQIGLRLKEAERLGFKRAVISKNNQNCFQDGGKSLEVLAVSTVKEALELL